LRAKPAPCCRNGVSLKTINLSLKTTPLSVHQQAKQLLPGE
jgi:hypothetical protein